MMLRLMGRKSPGRPTWAVLGSAAGVPCLYDGGCWATEVAVVNPKGARRGWQATINTKASSGAYSPEASCPGGCGGRAKGRAGGRSGRAPDCSEAGTSSRPWITTAGSRDKPCPRAHDACGGACGGAGGLVRRGARRAAVAYTDRVGRHRPRGFVEVGTTHGHHAEVKEGLHS